MNVNEIKALIEEGKLEEYNLERASSFKTEITFDKLWMNNFNPNEYFTAYIIDKQNLAIMAKEGNYIGIYYTSCKDGLCFCGNARMKFISWRNLIHVLEPLAEKVRDEYEDNYFQTIRYDKTEVYTEPE
ncbi:hypothetical protein [Vibrio phage vB_VmeM-Yong XC32]|nr:hypothetical protein [Vibrio phage vB_VmeM-Yong XC31]QAX96402.1 hypothetical protein [Vibrio phage vB_VmeM-Yong XC32]QAX96719.1 hypothetical protein [Vibrio phage vB_VmeM-Yong MS31]QAX97038.1 hypothetical protein [Vibrio phage vB_VmeM-Yong MS32]